MAMVVAAAADLTMAAAAALTSLTCPTELLNSAFAHDN